MRCLAGQARITAYCIPGFTLADKKVTDTFEPGFICGVIEMTLPRYLLLLVCVWPKWSLTKSLKNGQVMYLLVDCQKCSNLELKLIQFVTF